MKDFKPDTVAPQAGKFYRTRSGERSGPAQLRGGHFVVGPWQYASDGVCCYRGVHGSHAYPEHDLVAEWTEATHAEPASTSDIEWGEWGPVDRDHWGDTYMLRSTNGRVEICYPVPKQPVVEEITLTVWGKDYLVTVTRRDGVVDDVAKISQIGASK